MEIDSEFYKESYEHLSVRGYKLRKTYLDWSKLFRLIQIIWINLGLNQPLSGIKKVQNLSWIDLVSIQITHITIF